MPYILSYGHPEWDLHSVSLSVLYGLLSPEQNSIQETLGVSVPRERSDWCVEFGKVPFSLTSYSNASKAQHIKPAMTRTNLTASRHCVDRLAVTRSGVCPIDVCRSVNIFWRPLRRANTAGSGSARMVTHVSIVMHCPQVSRRSLFLIYII